MTQSESKCPLLSDVLKSLQATSYLESLADINSELEKGSLASMFTEKHNTGAFELRKMYLDKLGKSVFSMVTEYAKRL